MCDQANHDNCEIVDELHLEITNLEMTIADLKVEIVEDLKTFDNNTFDIVSYGVTILIRELKKKWEGK